MEMDEDDDGYIEKEEQRAIGLVKGKDVSMLHHLVNY